MKKVKRIFKVFIFFMIGLINKCLGYDEMPEPQPLYGTAPTNRNIFNLVDAVFGLLFVFIMIPLVTAIGIKKSLKNKKQMIDGKEDSISEPQNKKKRNGIIAVISVGMMIMVLLVGNLIIREVNDVFRIIVITTFLGITTSFLLKYCKKIGYTPFFVCNLLFLFLLFVVLGGLNECINSEILERLGMFSFTANIGICLFLIGYNYAIYIFQLIGKKRLLDYWTIFSTAVVHFAMAFLFMRYNNIFLPGKYFLLLLLQGLLFIASICFCNLCKDETENNKYILIKDIIITLMVVMLIIFSIVLYK